MKRSMSGKRPWRLLVAVVLLIGCVVGGTVAWLVAKTATPLRMSLRWATSMLSLSETRRNQIITSFPA